MLRLSFEPFFPRGVSVAQKVFGTAETAYIHPRLSGVRANQQVCAN